MKYPLCFFILSLLVGCNTPEKTDVELFRGNVIIEGKVRNFENSSKILRFAGCGVDDIDETAILDSLGNFRIKIELFNPQNVNLFYENGLSYLYLKPADSLFVDIDADLFKKDHFPYYEISGSNSSTSQSIRDFL